MNWWGKVKERLNVLRPIWLTAVIVSIVSIGLQHPQAVDALNAISDRGLFGGRNLGFLVALLILANASWYFPRALLYVKYSFTPDAQIGEQAPRYERWRRWAPRILGVLPLLSATLAFGRGSAWAFVAVYLIVALAFSAFMIWRRKLALGYKKTIYLHDEMPTITFVMVLVFLLLGIVLLGVFLASKVSAPQLVGPLGIVFLAASSWVAFGSIVLIYPTYRYRLPSLFLILLALTGLFSIWNDNHQIRTITDAQSTIARPSTVDHFSNWLDYRNSAIQARSDYPVFIVAAEGGGIRAAYWTAAVLGALQNAEPQFACHVFAISGISGGSLGAAAFSALVADFAENHEINCDSSPGLAVNDFGRAHLDFLGEDLLSPALAGMLYPDLVQRFLPTNGNLTLPDRATYLESAMEQEWTAQTSLNNDRFANDFLDLWASRQTTYNVPSLFLNGTWVESGGRVVTSNLRPNSGRFAELDDMLDALQKKVSVATAVHMSARFTYISPAGTVETPNGTRHVVDGGYFENSGALTATEIYQALADNCAKNALCNENVRFVALIISNNPASANAYRESDPQNFVHEGGECRQIRELPDHRNEAADNVVGPAALKETLSPVWTLFQTRTARGLHAEERLRSTIGPCNAIRFQLHDIGDLKIPLGWVLSDESQQNIAAQAAAAPGMESVRGLLTGSVNP
jgi:hypothetical protein